MKVTETHLKGCFIIEPQVFVDERGYFFESFHKDKFQQLTNIEVDFLQDNEAFSNRGIIRGLHFQKGQFAQAKLSQSCKRKGFRCSLRYQAWLKNIRKAFFNYFIRRK